MRGDNGIWVWRVRLDQPPAVLERLATTLCAGERARAAALRHPVARARFTAARGVLRAVLGSLLGREAAALRFTYGQAGKPALQEAELSFNVSHSGELALIAVAARGDLGLDVERLRPVPGAGRVAERWFAPSERAYVEQAPAEARDAAFLQVWTCKEAVLKVSGEGLGSGLTGLEIRPGPAGSATLVRLRGAAPPPGWFLRTWFPTPGYVAALAGSGPEAPLRFRVWPDEAPPRGGWPE